MTAHTKGSGLKWVGRAIRRLEDPALIRGQGRFTADLPAVYWVRFVRSAVAAGKIKKINAPKGAFVVTAADLKSVKKITPMLHKFNYKPVGQSVLADGQVRLHEQEPPLLAAFLLLHALLSGGDGLGILAGEEEFACVAEIVCAGGRSEETAEQNEEDDGHASFDGGRETALQDLAGGRQVFVFRAQLTGRKSECNAPAENQFSARCDTDAHGSGWN